MSATIGRPVGPNRATAARLAQAGWPVPHIATRLGVTESVAYRHIKAAGITLTRSSEWHGEHWNRHLRRQVSIRDGVVADTLTLAEYREVRGV